MTIEELNTVAASPNFDDFVRVCEARQTKALSKIADAIAKRKGTRLVFVAGGSSAGKTTCAKRLCIQLMVDSIDATYLSTDDYFVGDARNPRDENGEFDYESIECVDRPLLAERLTAIFEGRKVPRRKFDFIAHAPYDADEKMSIGKNGIVVIEGLHALNPDLVKGVANRFGSYGVFVEPVSQPILFGVTRLPSRDARLLRRIVRDGQFRKMTAGQTLAMWPKVLAGEEKWILPFKDRADAKFDSSLPYELSILKPYAQGLLEKEHLRNPGEMKTARLLRLLEAVNGASSVAVPGDSIIRETIGGSQLEY